LDKSAGIWKKILGKRVVLLMKSTTQYPFLNRVVFYNAGSSLEDVNYIAILKTGKSPNNCHQQIKNGLL
jgi:hypothetical protein